MFEISSSVRIRVSVWLASDYAHVLTLLSHVIVSHARCETNNDGDEGEDIPGMR